MWAVAAQNKKYNDVLGAYNSLRDPHLNSYFRKPQIRRHLLKANIINKDNKIVDEIRSVKHQQSVERKQKRELYQLLTELVKRNRELRLAETVKSGRVDRQTLIQQARQLFYSDRSQLQNGFQTTTDDHSQLLQKLDRMIRTIKEYNSNNDLPGNRQHPSTPNIKLPTSKSWHDLSNKTNDIDFHFTKLLSSTRVYRPKSSYGRPRQTVPKLNASNPDLSQFDDSDEVKLKKTKSVFTLANSEESEIESLDGESLDGDSDEDYLEQREVLFQRIPIEMTSNSNGKKYYAFDKRFVKNASGRQRVRMTLQFHGLNGATNGGAKRSIKVLQQVTVGGNAILIYDGFVMPGDVFTFDVRPHLNNSFAINVLVNGIRDLRLNTCCEHKHRRGTRLSHFTIIDVVGGRPCFACQAYDESSKRIEMITAFTPKMAINQLKSSTTSERKPSFSEESTSSSTMSALSDDAGSELVPEEQKLSELRSSEVSELENENDEGPVSVGSEVSEEENAITVIANEQAERSLSDAISEVDVAEIEEVNCDNIINETLPRLKNLDLDSDSDTD